MVSRFSGIQDDWVLNGVIYSADLSLLKCVTWRKSAITFGIKRSEDKHVWRIPGMRCLWCASCSFKSVQKWNNSREVTERRSLGAKKSWMSPSPFPSVCHDVHVHSKYLIRLENESKKCNRREERKTSQEAATGMWCRQKL